MLKNKRILLGVTGGIAAYKSADLVRRLKDAGAEVRVVMTAAATQFVTPLTFQALSGNRVHTQLLDSESEAGMGHIDLARWADALLIAPASANFLAKLTYGLADDLLSTLALATSAPIAVAPAMNQQMWANPATQYNIQKLHQRDIFIYGPAQGSQACGEEGLGRMLEPMQLVTALSRLFETGTLQGLKVLVTAGPTYEDIDPVRFIGNRSSGKMGYTVATAAKEAGAEVTLISGPTSLSPPLNVECINVRSAKQMYDAVMSQVDDCDIFIAAAAVADFSPTHYASQKIKKQSSPLKMIELEQTKDILATVSDLPERPYCIGFAAESDHLEKYAQDKLKSKRLDIVAANWINRKNSGFESDHNALTLYWGENQLDLSHAPKLQLAQNLISFIAEKYHAQHRVKNS